ncbi:hypothetical protein GCM10010442_75920 [Kitasatospora kifunensis]
MLAGIGDDRRPFADAKGLKAVAEEGAADGRMADRIRRSVLANWPAESRRNFTAQIPSTPCYRSTAAT